jgi:hypothetical protein
MKKHLLFLLLLPLAVCITSCDPDEVEDEEEELITTLIYTLTPDGGGDVATLTFRDLDGDGGAAGTTVVSDLAANTTYSGVIEVLNESETPTEDITEEVSDEDDEHQFFFSSTDDLITVAYSDADGDGNPLGVLTSVTTGAAGSTDFTVTLRHEPAKDAEGVSDGDISNAGGETDIEVTFSVDIQ